MTKDDCIFCKIANGEIPSKTVYEDADFRVILDISPATDGHVLILPKNHYDDIFGLDEDVCQRVMPLAKKVMAKLKEVLECDGYNVLQNNGSVAGQTVFHYHMHLIPRYAGDELELTWTPKKLEVVEQGLLSVEWNKEI